MKDKNKTVRVKLVQPGVVACGRFTAGVEYDVSEGEAERLVAHKGFQIVKRKKED